MQQIHAAAAARRVGVAVPAHSEQSRRPLLIAMPTRTQALAAQKANLVKFAQDNAQAFAALPFEPWTRMERAYSVATRIAASSIPGCVGLQGVRLVNALRTDDGEDKPVLYYPGLLVTEQLFMAFQQTYHCPTALDLPALDFNSHRVLVIGDPTSEGAIINDGVHSGLEGEHLCTAGR
jgi:hypothetical protein